MAQAGGGVSVVIAASSPGGEGGRGRRRSAASTSRICRVAPAKPKSRFESEMTLSIEQIASGKVDFLGRVGWGVRDGGGVSLLTLHLKPLS